MSSQSIVKTLHVWIGLSLGALVSLTCLSGSIVVFRPELEAAFSPKAAPSVTHVNLDDAVARVAASAQGAKLTRILLPDASRNTFVLTLESGQRNPRRIVIDAGTGAIAGELNVAWLDWIVDLHHNLLSGHEGRQVVGVIGMVLFGLSGTGVWLWLLRRPSPKALVTVRRGRRFSFEMHRAIGLWVYALLALLSFTGIALALPDLFRAALGSPAVIPKTERSADQSLLPLSDYLNLSRVALIDADLTELRLPKSPKDPVSVRFREESDLGGAGRNEIAIEASGRILGIRRLAGESTGVRIQGSFTPIHYAEVGGLAAKILWSIAGLAPSVLFITGLLVWFRKKPRRGIEQNQQPREAEREFLVTRPSL